MFSPQSPTAKAATEKERKRRKVSRFQSFKVSRFWNLANSEALKPSS
jgi:hypothetical protein